jgi:hypothetical protein
MIVQATLDGANVSPSREIWLRKVPDPNAPERVTCDALDALDGYFDARGAAHVIAYVQHPPFVPAPVNTSVELLEGGKQTKITELPPINTSNNYPPKLLVDAKGRQHLIAHYNAGEHPCFRDYLIGSNDEPEAILSAKGPKGTIYGFQAYQGPRGRMVAVMQTTDDGRLEEGDTWLSFSDGAANGGKWTEPICITNNAARRQFAAKQGADARQGDVALATRYGPGEGAVAFDRDGHLLLALVNVKVGTFAVGGSIISGSATTAHPILFFYRF